MPDNDSSQIDLEAGVVTLKKGDDVKSFKLSDSNDLQSLIKLGQRGWYFDDEASKELGDLRKVVSNWDSAIEAARGNDDAMGQLIQKLELAIGRPLTRKEEQQLDKGQKPQVLLDDEENSRFLATIDELRNEITELKKSQADFKRTNEQERLKQLENEISAQADSLEKKYPGKDGSPKFDRKEVFDFATKKGVDDLELAFKLLNFDKLTQHAKKQALDEYKAQQDNRKAGFTETGDQSAELDTTPVKHHKTYHKLGQNALKAAKNEGLSLFTND